LVRSAPDGLAGSKQSAKTNAGGQELDHVRRRDFVVGVTGAAAQSAVRPESAITNTLVPNLNPKAHRISCSDWPDWAESRAQRDNVHHEIVAGAIGQDGVKLEVLLAAHVAGKAPEDVERLMAAIDVGMGMTKWKGPRGCRPSAKLLAERAKKMERSKKKIPRPAPDVLAVVRA
jgi:hypothetical protein